MSTLIPDLRSPYATVGGLVHFGRMLDKIRLHQAGRLPPAWAAAMGAPHGLDGRLCRFLRVDYAELQVETLKGGDDDTLLEWAFTHGRRLTPDDLAVFNGYLTKLGWRDAVAERVKARLQEAGLPLDAAVTVMDFIEIDEGRPPRFS